MLLYTFLVMMVYFHRGDGTPQYKCDFEHSTMCQMNDQQDASVNFAITTGSQATSDNKKFGPLIDHTLKTPFGHFLNWYRPPNETRMTIDGLSITPSTNLMPDSCFRFAYFINSSTTTDRLTTIIINVFYCGQLNNLWQIETSDSLGWQTVEQQLPIREECSSILKFFTFVSSNATQGASVSFDDIIVDSCQTMPTPRAPLTPVTPSRAPTPPKPPTPITPVTPSRAPTPPKPSTPLTARTSTRSSGQYQEPYKLFLVLTYIFVILRK
jgi:hypothetical protein